MLAVVCWPLFSVVRGLMLLVAIDDVCCLLALFWVLLLLVDCC